MNAEVPIQKVIDLRNQNLSNEKIIESLLAENYSYQQIRDAIQQAEIKKNVSNPATPIQQTSTPPAGNSPSQPSQTASQPTAPPSTPPSTPPSMQRTSGSINVDEIQRILEEIIEEKWKESEEILKQIIQWKTVVNTKIKEVESRMNEFNSRIESMNSILGKKAEEFNDTMKDVDTEIKALDKALNKLIPTLSDNISELKDIVSNKK